MAVARAAIGGMLLILALAGCSSPAEPSTSDPEKPTSGGSTSAIPSPPATLSAPDPVEGETTVIAAESQSGSISIGTFETTGDRIEVDLRCAGSGEVQLELPNIGSFPLPCSADGSLLTSSSFAVQTPTFGVGVTATPDQLWSIRVSVAATK